jgi:hypothetical protein
MTDTYFYFASPVYASEQPEFLDVVSEVSKDMLAKLTHDPHEIYPMFNTDDFATDPRMNEFCAFVAQTGWNVLKEQGYAMENFSMSVDSAWSQKHFMEARSLLVFTFWKLRRTVRARFFMTRVPESYKAFCLSPT